MPRPKASHEHRPEDDARDRIQDLDVGAEHVGEEADPSERDPGDDAERGADEEADQRLFQGNPDLVAQGADRGSLDDPGVEAPDDAGGHSVQDDLSRIVPDVQLPAAQDHDQEPDLAQVNDDSASAQFGAVRLLLRGDLVAFTRGREFGDNSH